MRFHRLLRDSLLIGALVLVGSVVHLSNGELDGYTSLEREAGEVGPLPDGKVLHVMSLGFERLVADLFWIRTLYYVGDADVEAAGFPALGSLAELVSDIDPEFTTVYVLLSGALSALANDPEAAAHLLEKGVQNIDYWKLHFLLGFNYFFEFQRYSEAGEQMQLAAEKGGPPYLPLLSSRLYAQAGSPETAMAFIQARLAEASTDEERQSLAERYKDLWITRDLAEIDAAIARYRAQGLGEPVDLAELQAAGVLEREHRDPVGGSYFIAGGVAATRLPFERLEVHLGWGAAGASHDEAPAAPAPADETQSGEGQ